MVARIECYNCSCEMQTLDEDAGNCSTSGLIPQSVEDNDANGRGPNFDGSGDEVDDSLSLFRLLRNL